MKLELVSIQNILFLINENSSKSHLVVQPWKFIKLILKIYKKSKSYQILHLNLMLTLIALKLKATITLNKV